MLADNHRDRSIHLAAISSLLSKGGTFLLQIVALPVAIRVLGPERFGIYAAVSATFVLLNFADFGIGPSVVRGVAEARASERFHAARRLFSLALAIVAGMVFFGAAGLLTVVHTIPVGVWLGASFEPYSTEIRHAADCGVLLIGVQMVAAVVGRAQAGCQEMHVANLCGAAGNALGAGAVMFCAATGNVTVVTLVLAVIGSAMLGSILNAIIFLARHPELSPSWFGLRGGGLRLLAMDSGGFGIAAVLVPFVQREGAKFIVARWAGPAEVGRLALVQQVAMYVAGLLIIYTGPLMPAVADAAGRHDTAWLERAYRRARLLWLAVAGASVGVAVTMGPAMLRAWVGPRFLFSRLELGCFFGSFALVLWAYINYVFLGAFGEVWQAARVLLVEMAGALLLGTLLLLHFGFAGFFAGVGLLAISMSAWLLPRAVRLHIAALS